MRAALLGIALISLAGCAPAGDTGNSPLNGAVEGVTAPDTLFVANKFGNTLSRVDLTSGEEVQRVDACTNPHELALSSDLKHVALACYGGTTVAIYNAADLSLAKTIELGENARPHGLVWHPGGAIYVTAEGRQSMFAIGAPLSDTPQVTEIKTNKRGSHMLAVAPDQTRAWTMDLGEGTVTLLDLEAGVALRSNAVGTEPEGISLSTDGKALWVSARGSNKALELDPETLEVRREVATGAFPLRLVIRPQGDVAITSNLAEGSLSVIDLKSAKVTRTIAVSSAAEAEARQQVTILWSPDGERIYVAETASDTVAEVDYASGKVTRRIEVGNGGDGLAVTS